MDVPVSSNDPSEGNSSIGELMLFFAITTSLCCEIEMMLLQITSKKRNERSKKVRFLQQKQIAATERLQHKPSLLLSN